MQYVSVYYEAGRSGCGIIIASIIITECVYCIAGIIYSSLFFVKKLLTSRLNRVYEFGYSVELLQQVHHQQCIQALFLNQLLEEL